MATGSFAYTIIVTTARAFRNYPGCTSDRNLRKEIPGDYQQLAVKLNVVRQTVSKWEQGLSVPDSDMLISISEVLEIPVSTLLGENVMQSLQHFIPTGISFILYSSELLFNPKGGFNSMKMYEPYFRVIDPFWKKCPLVLTP